MDDIGIRQVHTSQVSDAAKDWGKTIAAVLSAGGIVALLQGGNKFGDLTSDSQRWLAILLLLALSCAVAAVVVAFDISWRFAKTDAEVSLAAVDEKGERARLHLHISMALTILALLLLVATALPLNRGKADSPPQAYLAYLADGKVVCGVLERTGDTLEVDGQELSQVTKLTEVPSCPKAP